MATQEDKTIADLMKPRYKVIGSYPGSNFNVGDVLSLNLIDEDERINKGVYFCYHGAYGPLAEYDLSPYPHLFQKLEWWQDREPDILQQVKYLRYGDFKGSHTIYEVGTWDLHNEEQGIHGAWDQNRSDYFLPLTISQNVWPATESDYDCFIKSKSAH